jgi:hypothetical protein
VEARARMGLYADNGSMLPGNLIQDFGFVSSSVTTLSFFPLTTNPTVRLNAKTVYWTAVVGDNAVRLPVPRLVNGMYNPILQVQLATGQSAHRNIFSYGTSSVGASTTLPLTMSSVASTYTVNSYFTSSGYIGPLLRIVYG